MPAPYPPGLRVILCDAFGEPLLSSLTTPGATDRGLIVRQVGTVTTVPSSPAAGTYVGDIGSPTVYVTSTPTLSVASGYTTNDYIGPSTTPAFFANVPRTSGGKVVIKSLTITDKTTTAAVAMEVWLFSATVTVPLDSAAWTISDADNLLCVGVIPVVTTNWYASAANKAYSDSSMSMVVPCAATSLFYAMVVRAVPPAWVDQDLQLSIGCLQA